MTPKDCNSQLNYGMLNWMEEIFGRYLPDSRNSSNEPSIQMKLTSGLLGLSNTGTTVQIRLLIMA